MKAKRQAIVEVEEGARKESTANLEIYKEVFRRFSEMIDKQTLDEEGNSEMGNNIIGYEEHGIYVEEEAVKNQLSIDKGVEQLGQELDEKSIQKLISIISFIEKPKGSFKDIIGSEDVKDILAQQWLLPIKFPNFFIGNRRPWDSILLYGLTGTGKSTFARILAAEIEAPFISVIGHKLRFDKLGVSENLIRDLFTFAKEKAPTVLLIDEIEGLFPATCRGDHDLTTRISSEFFDQIKLLSNFPKSVIILGATNKPNRMDKSSLDKFEKLVYVDPPGVGERAHIFSRNMANADHVLTQGDFEALARRTEGYTGADIVKVVRNARMKPLGEVASAIHFKKIDTPSKIENEGIKCFWTACDSKDRLAMQMTWRDIPNAEDLIIPKLTLNRMFQAVLRVKPSSTGISTDKIATFRRGLMNEYIIHDADDRDSSLVLLRENRKWYDCFLECFVG